MNLPVKYLASHTPAFQMSLKKFRMVTVWDNESQRHITINSPIRAFRSNVDDRLTIQAEYGSGDTVTVRSLESAIVGYVSWGGDCVLVDHGCALDV